MVKSKFFNRFKDIPLKAGGYTTVRPLGIIPREEFLKRLETIHEYLEEGAKSELSPIDCYEESDYFKYVCSQIVEMHGIKVADIDLNVLLSLIIPTGEKSTSILFELNYPDESKTQTKEQKLELRKRQEEAELLKEDVTDFTVSVGASILGLTESFVDTKKSLEEFPAFELIKIMEERGRQIKRAEIEAKEKGSNKPSRAMLAKAKKQAEEFFNKTSELSDKDTSKPKKKELDLSNFI